MVNYITLMVISIILSGIIGSWVFLTTVGFKINYKINLIFSVAWGIISFFCFNYFVMFDRMVGEESLDLFALLFALGSILAIILLQFASTVAKKATFWWKFVFIIHVVVITFSLVYYFFN